MALFESIADRQIRKARDEGLFDGLEGTGKPIRDLDRRRKPGWFADRLVKDERSRAKAADLEQRIRAAMPSLWREPNEQRVRARVEELNQEIADYNRVTSLEPRAALQSDDVVAEWRTLDRYR